MLCGDRYRGLGGDLVASLWAGAALVKQQEVEEARLGRLMVRYKNEREEYIRCRALGTLGMGYRAVARKHGIALVLLSRFNKREYQKGLDSTEVEDDSSDEESSTGDFKFCVGLFMGNIFLYFVGVGLRAGMEGFHPVHALRPALHLIFFYISRLAFSLCQLWQMCELLHVSWVVSGHGRVSFLHVPCDQAQPSISKYISWMKFCCMPIVPSV